MSKRIGEISSNRFYRDVRRHRNQILNEIFGGDINDVAGVADVADVVAADDAVVNADIDDVAVNADNVVENVVINADVPDVARVASPGSPNHADNNDANLMGIVDYEVDDPDDDYDPNELLENILNFENDNVQVPGNISPIHSSSSEDDNLENNDPEAFKSKLAVFIKKSTLSRALSNELLKLLRENGHPELPKTRETLLGTPRFSIHPRPCGTGEYYHFGLEKSLVRCNYQFLIDEENVHIDIGIDGLSLAKSSKLKIWPISGAFVNKPNISPFLIGAYKGSSDPDSINSFLFDLVEELKVCYENGIKVTPNQIIKPFSIRAFICDTPARSFVTGCVGHNAYYGCSKCDQHGVYMNKTTYSTVRENSRTDVTFFNREQPEHHKEQFRNELTLLETVNIGMVSQFPLDVMHAIDSGLMKRMLESILHGPCNLLRLRNDAKYLMDAVNLRMISYIPTEFERKPRSLITELPRFKAVEFRLFLLYTGITLFYFFLTSKSNLKFVIIGIVILKDYVGPDVYNHFLLLFVAIRSLACPATCIENADFADELLQRFIAEYPHVYDPTELVFNVHAALHLVECVRQFGPIYGFSAYRFENYMREIRKYVKKPNKILQQIHNRLFETNFLNVQSVNMGFGERILDNDVFPGCHTSYKSFKFNSFIIKNNLRDSCCMISGVPVEVQGFGIVNNVNVLFAKPFLNLENFFVEPVESMNTLGIMLVDAPAPDDEIFTYKVEDVDYKLVRLPYKDRFVIIPMLHHLTE